MMLLLAFLAVVNIVLFLLDNSNWYCLGAAFMCIFSIVYTLDVRSRSRRKL